MQHWPDVTEGGQVGGGLGGDGVQSLVVDERRELRQRPVEEGPQPDGVAVEKHSRNVPLDHANHRRERLHLQ